MEVLNRIRNIQFIIIGLAGVFICSCKKGNDSSTLAALTTTDVSHITQNAATSGGNISSEGGTVITKRGVCWSTQPGPTISNDTTSDGSGMGSFTSKISGLHPSTTNYVRAYATNKAGTAYGNEISFTTPKPDTIAKDADGNIYHFKTLGTQVWMIENLRTTKYADGSTISTTNPVTFDISGEAEPKYQWAYDESYLAAYGRLYTGYALAYQNVCPTGWHVPADAEWDILTDFLGGPNIAAGKLVDNSSGLKFVPGGGRDPHGAFNGIGLGYSYWSSTVYQTINLWDRFFNLNENVLHKDASDMSVAFSVRCILNN